MKTNEKQTIGNHGILFKITTSFAGVDARDSYCYALNEQEAVAHSQACNDHYRSRDGFKIVSVEALPDLTIITKGTKDCFSTSLGQSHQRVVTIEYHVIQSEERRIITFQKIEKGYYTKINIPFTRVHAIAPGWQIPRNIYPAFKGNIAIVKASTLDKIEEAAYQEAINTPWN